MNYNYTTQVYQAVSANFQGTPVICGGSIYEGDFVGRFSNICYGFTNGQWEEFATIQKARKLAAGIMHKGAFNLHLFPFIF